MKTFPFKKNALITEDSMSFQNINYDVETEVPRGNHIGAFGYVRKNHTHEGVDLYCHPWETEKLQFLEDPTSLLLGAIGNLPK